MKLFQLIFLSVFALISCGKAPKNDLPDKPTALVSIGPYKSMVERITGGRLHVLPIVPLNANPHIFEPTSKQVKELKEASVWFRIGEPFEDKLLTVLKEKNRDLLVYDLRDHLPLLKEASSCSCHAHDLYDRHIWLSPKLLVLQADRIEKILSSAYPEYKKEFSENFLKLQNDLENLDVEIQGILKGKKEKTILVSHSAFAYFCSDYQIEELSVEFEGKEPRPKHLETLLKTARDHHAEFAIALPQHDNKGTQLIAEKLRIPVRWVDPYSVDYFTMMRHLAHLIANPQYQP